MRWNCFNSVYLFLTMCCIPVSLLHVEADDKEGRNYTVMQTVKSKKRHSCWDERETPASFWKLTNVGFLLPQLRSLCQQGPNCKTEEKFPNPEQFRALFSTTILLPKESFWPKQDNFLLHISFFSHSFQILGSQMWHFFPLSVRENNWKGNALMLIASGEEAKKERGGKLVSTMIYTSLEVVSV